MKFKLIYFFVAIFILNLNCCGSFNKKDSHKFEARKDYHYTPQASYLKFSFDNIMSEIKTQIETGASKENINENIKFFAEILSNNFNDAYIQCKNTKPESVKDTETRYKELVKRQCKKLIIPLLNKVKRILKILSKKENEDYRNQFFSYLEHKHIARDCINTITRDYTDKKVDDMIDVISFQIARAKFQELESLHID